MSISTETSRSLFTGNGATTVFGPAFYFRLTSELVVTLTPSGGTPVIQVEGVDYTVALPSDVGQADGEVTMAVAPALNAELKIERTVPFTQPTSLRQAGTFDPAAHEDQYDELTFQTQQLHRRLSDVEDGSLTGDFVAGNGLSMAGTTLNVGAGPGIQSNADTAEVIFGVVGEMNVVASDAAAPGAAGGADKAARIDHQHVAVTAAPAALAVGQVAGQGAAVTLARADHQHAVPVAAPVAVDAAAAVTGASGNFSDANHKHQVSVAAPAEITDTTEVEGVADTLARSDHQHGHGDRGGGTLHANATAVDSGFMPAAIYAPLAAIKQAKTHVRAWQSILQAIPHFSTTTIIFDTEDYDTDAEYDNATGIFTAKNDGYYLVSAGVNLAGALWAAGNSVSLAIFRNAVPQGGATDVIDAALNRATTARVAFGIFLATGDTLHATVIHNQGGPVNTVASRVSTWLTIDRVL